MVSSASDWVAGTISPRSNSFFTTSAGVRPVFSAMSCALAPRLARMVGRASAGAGSAGGATSATGSTTAVAAGTFPSPDSVGAAPTSSGSAGFSGRRSGRGATVAVFGLAPGTVLPPEARRRGMASSGTADEAVRPPRPISSRAARMSLLGTPSSLASSCTLTSSASPSGQP